MLKAEGRDEKLVARLARKVGRLLETKPRSERMRPLVRALAAALGYEVEMEGRQNPSGVWAVRINRGIQGTDWMGNWRSPLLLLDFAAPEVAARVRRRRSIDPDDPWAANKNVTA